MMPAGGRHMGSLGDNAGQEAEFLCEPRGPFVADEAGQAGVWSPAWSLWRP